MATSAAPILPPIANPESRRELERGTESTQMKSENDQCDETKQQLICFVDRHEAQFPDFLLLKATGVIVPGPDFLRAVELPLWIDYPLGWNMVDAIRGRSHDGKLEVAKLGEYWFVGRREWDFDVVTETIVEPFGQNPIGTRTSLEAMLVAEHCHPAMRLPIGAKWHHFK